MKKVRLVGAAFLAPSLGFAVGVPNAQAADHPKPGPSAAAQGKTVRMHPETPNCNFGSHHSKEHGADGQYFMSISIEVGTPGPKVCQVVGSLPFGKTGLEMRTRVYHGQPGAGDGIYSGYVHGDVRGFGAQTVFVANLSIIGGSNVCTALVNSKNHASVKYGAVCLHY